MSNRLTPKFEAEQHEQNHARKWQEQEPILGENALKMPRINTIALAVTPSTGLARCGALGKSTGRVGVEVEVKLKLGSASSP